MACAGSSLLERHFGESAAWSIGVEEEVMILDGDSLEAVPRAAVVIADLARPNVKSELFASIVELATGALGVLIRRSPLIVLLSLEIMLNGANLALIAVSRHYGEGTGQIFALAVMAVAASEVVVGLGLIVAMARKHLALDVDKLTTLRG